MKEQLEIYKIVLRGNPGDNFGKFVIDKFGRTRSKSPSDVFIKMFRCLIHDIDTRVWRSDTNLTGITILKQKGEKTEEILTLHSNSFVIEGYIDGGHYDMLRRLTQLSDTSKTTQITRDSMVSDRFYVYMHINPDENIGVVMIERKGQISISKTFVTFIEHFFKVTNARKCHIERYIPPYIIEEFRRGSVVDSVTCTEQLVKQIYDAEGTTIRNSHYEVMVKIRPIDDDDRCSNKLHILEHLRSMMFSLTGRGEDYVRLADFSKRRGTMKQSDGSSCNFEFDDDETIRPIININENFLSENKDILVHEDIKSFCDSILERIKVDIYAVGQ